jgi:hypothetical protein
VIFVLWFLTLVAIVVALFLSLVLLISVLHPFICHRHGDPCHFAPLAYWCKSSSYLQMIFVFLFVTFIAIFTALFLSLACLDICFIYK